MEIAPMVNQMETHVFNQQHKTREFMDEFGTKLMAWAPLAEGQNGLFTNPTLTQIGEKYGKTAAQIAALDTAHSLFLDHHDGETTKQFMEWRAVVKPTEQKKRAHIEDSWHGICNK